MTDYMQVLGEAIYIYDWTKLQDTDRVYRIYWDYCVITTLSTTLSHEIVIILCTIWDCVWLHNIVPYAVEGAHATELLTATVTAISLV